ncbi:MAG: FAD-dependent oxidoreductase [Thermoleophilaceae bacterium]|nr:FAD-dependent oxidoreductase [Thermoleophilaceae bacterium]
MRYAVLGAGMAGLTAAHRLAVEGHEVDVYERWPGLGGEAATLDTGDGVLLERYYHHLFTSDHHIAGLCDEIGLPDVLERWPSSVAMFAEGELHPFTSPLDLLRYKPLSLWSRIRLGMAVVLLQKRGRAVEPYEPITIRAWVERNMGREVYAKLWGPLLRGKFGDRADQISMSWLWAKLHNRRQTTGEEARQELLVYPKGTFETIFVRLRDRIEERGGRVLIDRPAARVTRDGDGFLVTAGVPDSFRRGFDPREFEPAGAPERYDGVVAALPSDIFEELLDPALAAEIGAEYLGKLHSIEYFAALCVVLELDREFHPYYWTNVADADLRFIGLIEQTNLVPRERYGGRRFLYIANYLPRDDGLLDLDLDEVMEVYEPGLRKVNPAFSSEWIRNAWLFKDPAAQPVVLPNYRDRMPALQTPARGLMLANTTQVYPDDRGTNYAVEIGERAVRELLDR